LDLTKNNVLKMSETSVNKRWYVVRAVSGQENKIKTYIENEISRLGLNDYVDQVLVPTEKVIQIRNGKKINKERVYFPGYIMVKANLSGEIPHIIRSITNVIGFLGETKGGDPVPLRQSEVNRMLGKVDEFSVDADANIAIPFTIGQTVKVIDGPFNGFDGTVEKINEEKRKLEVMVKIFGRKTPLELSYMQVEKV
jgi:transcriptional antiterminator NusG